MRERGPMRNVSRRIHPLRASLGDSGCCNGGRGGGGGGDGGGEPGRDGDGRSGGSAPVDKFDADMLMTSAAKGNSIKTSGNQAMTDMASLRHPIHWGAHSDEIPINLMFSLFTR